MKDNRELYILWTNSNIETSILMVMMYAKNSMLKRWWDKVTVIIWGDTARLTAENEMIQAEIKIAMKAGVNFSACIACASQLGVVEKLEELGIDVIPWGPPLTEILQSDSKLITI